MEGTSSGDPSTGQTSNSSAKLVEIKIKTLDSQVYSCSVEENITVPALKDHIATLTGVPAENQRLICRGKVLKDDHTLTDYNVEDGHTLHLVTRQVPQSGAATSSAGANAGEEEQRADDPSNGAARNTRPTQISHSVVMGTFNVPDNGDGGLPDVNRIITSVLQSLGLGNILPNAGPNTGGPGINPPIVAVAPAIDGQDTGSGGGARPMNVVNQPVNTDRGVGVATWPTAGLGMVPTIGQQVRFLQQAMVTPDALTIINQYLDGLQQAFVPNGLLAGQGTPPLDAAPAGNTQTPPVGSPVVIRGHPTTENLGATIQRTMSLINGQWAAELHRLSSQLENESSTADTVARGELQSAALRDGVLLQHLGALLLELGRVTLTLRVGPSAMESLVNAGPAVFISPAGPNPMMVQPVPFQPGPGFGTPSIGTHHTAGAMGYPEVPRNVSIHIHANNPGAIPGFPASVQGPTPGNPSTQVPGSTPVGATPGAPTTPAIPGSSGITPSVHAIAVPMQVSGPSASNEQPGIRVVPMRAVVAAVPANLQSRSMIDGSGAHPNILHPFFARFQQLTSQQGVNLPGGTHSNSTATPPASAAQQTASLAAPVVTIPEMVAPDRHGVSRTAANEALFVPPNTSQPPMSLISQHDQQCNTTEPFTHLREQPTGISINANDTQSTDLQRVSRDQQNGGNTEAAREIIMNEGHGAENASTAYSHETAIEEEKPKDGSKTNVRVAHETAIVEEKPKDGSKTNVPAGLGLGGLRALPSRTPKRSGRQQRPMQCAGTSEQGEQNLGSPANNQGGLVASAGAERNAQGPSVIADSRSSPSQTSQLFHLLNNTSSRPGSGANFDIGNLMSQFAANAGAMRPRDQDQGMGLSAGALGSLMGQVMQNPFMRNVVQQVVEQVGEGTFDHEDLIGQGETGNPQSGVDFSRLLQGMMPVVSQAINRASNNTSASEGSIAQNGGEAFMRQGLNGFADVQSNGSNVPNGPNIMSIFQQIMPVVAQAFGGAASGQTEQLSRTPVDMHHLRNADGRETAIAQVQISQGDEQPNFGRGQAEAPSCEEPGGAPVVKRQKIDVEKALEKLEQGSPPNDIVRVVAETASTLLTPTNNQEPNIPLLAQFLCEDNGLADDYMALLLSELASCKEEDA